ncbi:MAG TPA: protein phosphatase 2C domain-containing protein [Vicinamibacterales bacterium]|nr:protein phosphatase 2C domain-containing protein [Vicinamibacterales bacterium]
MIESRSTPPRLQPGQDRAPASAGWQAAGRTDTGLVRRVNEDRFHIDEGRGVVMVIDGLGGQAAGGKAADTALSMLRTRLERQTGPIAERIREAITIANNEIHRLAATRAEWHGMACVLTVAVIENGRAVIGHVGDTRLYKLRANGPAKPAKIEKVTRDHSPVGEREDALELSESEAMRHPRRNEVYRDVGSERHEPYDPDFVDICEVTFESDASLLVCSDGLTDAVSSGAITQIVQRFAGDPRQVVQGLVEAANAAGGKDNVTVVYVEREQFAADTRETRPNGRRGFRRLLAGAVLVALAVTVVITRASSGRPLPALVGPLLDSLSSEAVLTVRPNESIAAAIARAAAGAEVIVEPGEYRERLTLRDGIRVVSRVPRGATIRLPSAAAEGEAAVVATGPMTAELVGFRIVGDAATSLGTGILIRDAAISVINCEITGAARTALEISGAHALVIGSDIHDNPGMALLVKADATPRVTHNVFARNGVSTRAATPVSIERGAHPTLTGNVFEGVAMRLIASDDSIRGAIERNNWFVPARRSEPAAAPDGRNR